MNNIMVISYNALMSSSPNGRTMQSLLQGIPSQNISLFTCYGMPDAGSCSSAFKVSNRDALRSLLRSESVGRCIDMANITDTQESVISQDVRKGARKAWKYLAKEIVWCLGKWKNKKLKEWLKNQKPEALMYMYGDTPSMQRFAVYVSKKMSIPLVVYSCEDYCFKDYNYIDNKKHSLAFKLYHNWSKRATKKLFKQASALITNSDQLGRDYQKAYNLQNVATVMMASNMSCIDNGIVRPIEETNITYLGALGEYRIDALIEIANALQVIDSRLKLDVYGRASSEVQSQLEACEGIRFHGFVPYETVKNVMRSSSLLIEAINHDEYVCKDKRYGLSTKYADSFACGTPFLVYAPEAIIETSFAKEHQCAFVAATKDELVDTLKTALFDFEARQRQLEFAQKVTARYFDQEKNIKTVCDILESVTK